MQIDALGTGVYGSLVTKESIKLLVCYIINNIEEPLPRNAFCEEIHAEGIANYFELREAFSDLTQKNLIKECENKRGYYEITKMGIETVTQLKRNLPYSVRKRAFFTTVKMIKKLKCREQTRVTAEALDSGEYIISCSIVEGEKEMLTIRLNAPNFETAQQIKNSFWDNPELIYSSVINLMTGSDYEYKENIKEFKDK